MTVPAICQYTRRECHKGGERENGTADSGGGEGGMVSSFHFRNLREYRQEPRPNGGCAPQPNVHYQL